MLTVMVLRLCPQRLLPQPPLPEHPQLRLLPLRHRQLQLQLRSSLQSSLRCRHRRPTLTLQAPPRVLLLFLLLSLQLLRLLMPLMIMKNARCSTFTKTRYMPIVHTGIKPQHTYNICASIHLQPQSRRQPYLNGPQSVVYR